MDLGHSRRSASRPARDHRRVGSTHRQPVHRRHRLAGHPDRRATAPLSPGDGEQNFRARTGLPLSPYFAGLELCWILDGWPRPDGPAPSTSLFGTIDGWLIWKLTGGIDSGVHATDVTNAGAHPADGSHHLPLGSAGSSPRWASRRACFPRSGPSEVYGHASTTSRVAVPAPRRPAGRPVRADPLRRRAGQVHLRHWCAPAPPTPARHSSRPRTGSITTVAARGRGVDHHAPRGAWRSPAR